MNNEYYGAPTRPNDDFLAHYGIKGMKWGVRKAVSSGSERRLGRQYAKASRKLAKLERRAANGKKYAKRAALLGAGAAAAGGLAAAGTEGVGNALSAIGGAGRDATRYAVRGVNKLSGAMAARGIRGSGKVAAAGEALSRVGHGASSGLMNAGVGVANWGRGSSAGNAISGAIRRGNIHAVGLSNKIGGVGNKVSQGISQNALKAADKAKGLSNNTIARIGAAGVGAGLLAGAGYNAYRAATTKRAARKAAQFRSEMNKAFAGTKYANGAPRHQGTQKKKKR